MRRNPWLDLPRRAPYILPLDAPYVHCFNENASRDHRIELSLLPDPFNGNLGAPIVVLLLNPGVNRKDFAVNARPDFKKRVFAALARPGQIRTHAFLADGMKSPGTDWWLRATRHLIHRTSRDSVARSILAVEFFPYHSRKFKHSFLRLPSQEFSFLVVRNAMRRGASVILARGEAQWFGAVPELASYRKLLRLKTVRRTFLSPRNVIGDFDALCRLLIA